MGYRIAFIGMGLLFHGLLTLTATDSSDAGKQVFLKRCSGCHAVDNERQGPHLRGVFGRKAGSIASFQYSDALKASGIVWDADSLDQWLVDPEKFVPGNEMGFSVPNPAERAAVIGYLKALNH